MSGVPAVRFPEFEGEWKEKKLDDVLRVKGRRNRDRRFGPKDVLSVSGDVGVVNQIKHLGRSYAGADVGEYHVVDPGDAVYTKSPLKANPFGIVRVNLGEPGIVSTLYAVYEVRDGHSPEFVNRYFESDDRTNDYLMPLVNKGAKNDMKISNERVLIDPVRFPALPEQRKVAAFLSAVDARIAAAGRERAGLGRFKAGLLQALFSRTIRFTPEGGGVFPDWEERRLGEVATFYKGRGVAKDDIVEEGATPCIRYGEVYTRYGERIAEVTSRTDAPIADLFLSEAGDVIIPASGETAEDMARACCVLHAGIALGSDLNVLRTTTMNGEFLAYYLSHARRAEIAQVAQGVSVVHLYASQLKCVAVQVPHPDEQARIAAALAALDRRLDLAAREEAALRRFKAGLLQSMFV